MGSIRYWYNSGKFEDLVSNPELISTILVNADKGLKVTWRTSGTRIPFYSGQFKLLQNLSIEKNIKLEAFSGEESLHQDAKSLLRRNRIFKGGLINIFIIDEDGLSGIYMFCEKHPDERFIMNKKGLQLEFLKGTKHPGPRMMAGLMNSQQRIKLWDNQLMKMRIDSAYLTNTSEKLVDCVDSSIFIIKDDKLYTPSESTGAYPRAIRMEIIRKSVEIGLRAIESDKLEPAHLDAADEIFLANDFYGIKWVVAHNNNRYFRKYSTMLLDLLNREWETNI